jgi:DNA polymerase-4
VRDLMLVDLDAFYVSVERRKDPSLLGRPVIVGGGPGERGVVASASYEARGYGVRAGMPLGQAEALCPKAVLLPGDPAAYGAASAEVMALLSRFAPTVEPVSLDEAFLDVTGCDRLHGVRASARGPAWLDAAERLHHEVAKATGLSVSIGIGGTRTVAKVAAVLAKPAGALEVPRGAEARFLCGLPVECLPGVGPRAREALARFNLHTVGDLARLPEDLLEETFGRTGVALSRRARGLDDEPVTGGRPAPKSISREVSFVEDTADRAVIGGTISQLAQRATTALRSERMRARAVAVRLRYADFLTVEARRRLPAPTDRDHDVLALVEALWPARYDRRVKLRLVGVSLLGLEPAGPRQLDLFDDLDVPGAGLAAARLDALVDRIRSRHGFGVLVRGYFGARPRRRA